MVLPSGERSSQILYREASLVSLLMVYLYHHIFFVLCGRTYFCETMWFCENNAFGAWHVTCEWHYKYSWCWFWEKPSSVYVSFVPDWDQHNHADGLHFDSSHIHQNKHIQIWSGGSRSFSSNSFPGEFNHILPFLLYFFIFLQKNLCIEKIHIVSKVHWKHCALKYIIMRKRKNS